MTETHLDRAVDRGAAVGHPHTGKCNSTTPTPPSHHRNTLCTCTNPKVLNTPRFKETDPWQLRDRQWHTDAILRALRVPHCRSGRDPQIHRDAETGTQWDMPMQGKPDAEMQPDV